MKTFIKLIDTCDNPCYVRVDYITSISVCDYMTIDSLPVVEVRFFDHCLFVKNSISDIKKIISDYLY